MKHKHHDMICQWAADTNRKVQCRRPLGQWTTLDETPLWEPGFEYRFADEVLRYRVALFDNGKEKWVLTTDTPTTAARWENGEGFARWLTDWTEVTEPNVEKPKPVKHEVWLSLYPDGSASIYRSKRLADECAGLDRIECRRIEWEVPA